MNYKIVNGSVSYGAETILEEINFELKEKDKIWYVETIISAFLSKFGINNFIIRLLFNVVILQILELLKLYCKEEEMFLYAKNNKRTKK